MTYEQARAKYAAYEQRYEALDEKDKRFFDRLTSVDIGNFDISMDEVMKIARLYDNNAINASVVLFNYGFIKGQRAARKTVTA